MAVLKEILKQAQPNSVKAQRSSAAQPQTVVQSEVGVSVIIVKISTPYPTLLLPIKLLLSPKISSNSC